MLEQAGLITKSRDAQRRPSRISLGPLQQVDTWLDGYRRLWEGRFDKMEKILARVQAVAREVEDLAAVIAEAGGRAMAYGMSSGAALVLEAVGAGLPISRFARDADGGGLPDALLASIGTPGLVVAGGASPGWMMDGAKAVAARLREGTLQVIPDQTHNVSIAALAPVLEAYFLSPSGRTGSR
ncbi:alpha/beta fold hydrolase [Myxococcus eversor]|uniref:alpha/beta fold hydrolase n=1 Tax=Myxococcus eversor TaxID=2709661 RepID=UPI0013CF7AB7|nr:hypothetical protein [Myxococcus eversor]